MRRKKIYDKEFSKYIKNKRIILVGSNKYLKEDNQGEFINSFDLVARVNHSMFIQSEEEIHIGNRTNISYTLPMEVEKIKNDKGIQIDRWQESTQWVCSCGNSLSSRLMDVQFIKENQGKIPFHKINKSIYEEVVNKIEDTLSHNLIPIIDLLSYDIKELYLIGLNIKKESELSYLKKIFEIDNRVKSDDYLLDKLDLDEEIKNMATKKKVKKRKRVKKTRKILLRNGQSPGDILMLSAAVRDLKKAYPNVLIDVKTSAGAIWENNPYITKFDEKEKDVEEYRIGYSLIHQSNEGPYHFVHGFRKELEKKLNLEIPATKYWGDIHISDLEKSWMSQVEEMGVKNKFWIIMAGGKFDFTCVLKGSRIQTENGYKKIEDIDENDKVLTEFGFKKCDGSVFRGIKKCIKLSTRLGGISVTENHRFKVIRENGKIEWSEARDLKVNDYILCRRGNLKNINIEEDDRDKWFALGRLWGDGYLHKNSCYWIFSEDEIDSKKRVINWLSKNKMKYTIKKRLPGNKDKVKRTKIDYRVSSKNIFNEDDLPLFKPKGEWRKNGFPDSYFYLSYVDIKAFLEGLFSSDGTIDNGHNKKDSGNISYTTIHKKFGEDIRRILWQVGITSTIRDFEFMSIWKKKCSGVRISIIGTKSRNNFSEIGFFETYKNKRMIKLNDSSVEPNDKFHGIPFAKNIIDSLKTKKNIDISAKRKSYRTKGDLKKSNIIRDSKINALLQMFDIEDKNILRDYINNKWYFDQIEKIEHIGKKEVYDIINSETESYIVEGMVSHNCKWWNPSYYQDVIDHFKDKITFVQCGEKGHWHPPLRGVVDLIGKTDLRQFIRLIYHSVGVLSPVTFAMHAAAATECKHDIKRRPAVIIAGGREPSQWESYPHHRFLAMNGALKCCDNGGCWKSRCQKVGDGDKKDKNDLCLQPVKIGKNPLKISEDLFIPKCMDMIKPVDVIRAIESYYEGGVLQYNSQEKK